MMVMFHIWTSTLRPWKELTSSPSMIDTDNLAMIATDGITAVGGGIITVLAAFKDDANTADMDETVAAFETDATFDGAPGTLKCAVAGTTDCTVTLRCGWQDR